MDIGPDGQNPHPLTIGHVSESQGIIDDSDNTQIPPGGTSFEKAGRDSDVAHVDICDGLGLLLRDPYCHGMEEIPSAGKQRARVLRYLRGQGDNAHNPDGHGHETTPVDPASPLFIHLSHGLALTVGSALGSIPPSTETCLEAFLVPNKAKLTAGARAWSKHAHRSQPSSFPGCEPLASSSEASSSQSQSLPAGVDSGSVDDGVAGLSESLEKLDACCFDSPPPNTSTSPPPKQKKERKKKEKKDQNNNDGWWGKPSGPVSSVNERALKLFWKVMDEATWKNLHWLPHQVLVYEVRVPEGYGMRWSQDQSPLKAPIASQSAVEGAVDGGMGESGTSSASAVTQVDSESKSSPKTDPDDDGTAGSTHLGRPWIFRGFVEPMMENGHEVGWRHPI